MNTNNLLPIRALVGLIALTLSTSLHAQPSETWDGGGGDDNWTTGNNWADNSAPANPQIIANFAGNTRLTPFNNFSGYSSGHRIFFNSGAGAFTLNGNPIKFFDWGGNRAVIQNDSSSTQTINFRVGAGNNAGGIDFGPNSGDIIYNGGSIDNGTIFLDDNSQLRVWGNAGRTVTFNKGIINGGGSTGTVAVNGSATAIFNTTGFTYTGDTFVNNGTLRLAVSGPAPSTTIRVGNTSGSNGANLNLDGGASITNTLVVRPGSSGAKTIANTASTTGTATYAGSLFLDDDAKLYANSGGTVALTGSTLDLKNQTLTVDGPGSTVINGALQQSTGNGKLTKSGAGTLTLTAPNTYSGATTISQGTLLVNGSTAAGSAVSVASSATLGGNGTVNGTVTVNSGGILSPGTSIGVLTLGASPSLGGTTLIEIDRAATTNSDKVVVSGASITYGGTLTITNVGGAAQNGDSFDLFDATSFNGTFSTLNVPSGGLAHWKTNNLVVDGSIQFINTAPVGADLNAGVVSGGTVSILVIGGKHSPTDAENDSLTISSVSSASNGDTGTDGSSISYTNTSSATSDSFTYTINDGFGGTDTRTVSIMISSAEGFNQISATTDGGNALLTYLGIPGTNYALEITHDLTPPLNWQPIVTNTAAMNGYLMFTNPISGPPTNDYYRTRYVP